MHSLNYKLLEPDLQTFIQNYDIVCLAETWLNDSVDNTDKCNLPGYDYKLLCRTKNSIYGRNSGGLLIMWKHHLRGHIKFIEWSSEFCVFEIQGEYFLFIYATPPNSSRILQNQEDIIGKLESLLFQYCDHTLYVFGDLNARTGDRDDVLQCDMSLIPKRTNPDKVVNCQGRQILDVLKTTNYCIANGRINPEDSNKFTYQSSNGSSVIDYVIIKKQELERIQNLKIHDDRLESDHFPLSFRILTTLKKRQDQHFKKHRPADSPRSTTKGLKYSWNPESAGEFRDELRNALEGALPIGVNAMVEHVNNAMYESAAKTKQHLTNPGIKANQVSHPWFDHECADAKREMVAAFKVKCACNISDTSTKYMQKRKFYVNLRKKKKRSYNKTIVKNLLADKRTNPKKLWNTLEWKTKNKKIAASKEDLQNHFEKIYENSESKMDPQWRDYIIQFNTWWESHGTQNYSDILDREINDAEILKNISKLQSGKAPGIDRIPPEFFKHCPDVSITALKIIFNEILDTTNYPTLWQHQLLSPIYKKGQTSDPNNYRGISLISTFSKIFLYILYARIENFCSSRGILCEEQGGYKKKRWTVDNAFTLSCQIQTALNQKEHLYVLFVDYSKCFDLISREGLWYKLVKEGLSGKCIKILKSIYEKVSMHLKYKGEVGHEITSKVGLKQGCPLSGILWSLYANDCANALSEGLDPSGRNIAYGTLMFADDTAIFARNADTMKTLISNLEKYTFKWGLQVNLEKTKMVLFRHGAGKRKIKNLQVNFTFSNEIIGYEDTYCYLGITFHRAGKWTDQVEGAKTKGRRSSLQLREKLRKLHGLPTKEITNLFKACVQSATLYGCEIWGTGPVQKLETIQCDFAKMALGVRRTTPNAGAISELGLLPYQHLITYRTIKFWTRIISENLPLQQQAYVRLLNCEGMSWCTQVERKLNSLGLGSAWIYQRINNPKQFLGQVLARIKSCHTQEFDATIRDKSRLSVLASLQTDPCRLSRYLSMDLSPYLKKTLSRLRLSSHTLGIEKGRWQKPIIPQSERLCIFCDLNEVDSEEHFIFECSEQKIASLRRTLIKSFPNHVTNSNKLCALLDNSDISIVRKLAIFCAQAERVRTDLMKSAK